MTDFAHLGVHPKIIKALKGVGITEPFPIQELSIPIALSGTDMIGQARTGTGKTLAFGIALLQRITVPADAAWEGDPAGRNPQALVMCPTRELALQVTEDLDVATAYRPAKVMTVYGGVGYEPQLDRIAKGVDVVVGTPGRLLDLLHRGDLDLSDIKILVLDEADEMLDMGFLPDVEALIEATPKERQTMLFSATMPAAIVSLARTHLNQPINVRAETRDAQLTVPDTTQFVYRAHDLDKPDMVGKILQAEGRGRTIIFTHTKRSAQLLADDLKGRGFKVVSLHGDLAQASRERALEKFRDGKADVLVATDVAARGIDVTDVTHVINYECPDNELTYVHRIGRTGRAGASGIAVTFVDWADMVRWKVINKALGLDFEEPPETYSTSENFLVDLNIAPGTKAWLKEPEDPYQVGLSSRDRDDRRGGDRRGGRDDRRGGRDDRRGGRDDRRGNRDRRGGERRERREEKPAEESKPRESRQKRERRRLRNGKPVEE
ncbi:MAG: DEAD/DEAH box helicase [Propionibacteriaceae bacterium]|jgi:superfamily II DNA/RNA helicase|nr:DEAD/DEAH box helicase [Propionibacteriaceae bacterium]